MQPAHHLARAKRLFATRGEPGDQPVDIEIQQIDHLFICIFYRKK